MSKSDLNKTWTLLPDPDELNGTVSLVTQSDTSPTSNPNATFTTLKTPTTTAVASNGPTGNYHSLFLNGSASKPTVSKYSPSKSATDYLLVRHLNIDESRVSAEWDNFEARFQDLESIHNYESLFDEVFNFPEESSLKSEEEAVVNKVINSEKTKSVTPISLSSCSSIDNNLDRLALSQTANEFNAQPLPNSFDMFANDLKKSSSSKHLNENSSSSSLNLPFLNSKSIQPLPFASSMENELNKMPTRGNNNSKPPFIESLDLQTSVRTSSPSKYNSVLNRTIDIDKGSSIESLDQPSRANLLANDDEENEVVLNTTYTSWSTDLNQAEKEACVQQEIINMKYGPGGPANKQTPNRTMVYSSSVQNVNNLTQDINNNSLNNDSALGSKNKKQVDLNRTYEMDEMMDVDDDQPMESNSGEPTRVLNRTHDLIDDNDLEPVQSAVNVTITKPVIAAPSAVVKTSSQTSSSRLSTIYNKPKAPTSTSKTPSPLQPKKTELIKPAVQVSNGGSGGVNTKLPVRNSIPTQIKSGIPSVKLISSTTSQQASSVPLTKQQSFSSTSNNQQQDVNRLSSSSTASSASTGSTKENRKSGENENKLNGETTTTTTTATTNTTTVKSSFGFVSKLKKPGVVAPTSQTNIPSAMNKMTSGVSKLPSGSSIPTIPKMPSSSALPTSALKNSTAIPKKPSSVLTLRNANSQLKK